MPLVACYTVTFTFTFDHWNNEAIFRLHCIRYGATVFRIFLLILGRLKLDYRSGLWVFWQRFVVILLIAAGYYL
jgi:hypothetical protein